MRHLEGDLPVWVAKTLGSNETQSREISCHHGLATFRSEISLLRFASVEMTGDGVILVLFMHFFIALLSLGLMGRQFLSLSDYISREAKRPGRNPSYAAAHNPWKRRGEDRSLHEIHLSGAPTI